MPEIPYIKKGEGSIIHFAHANGFPPEAYQQFLAPFQKKYQIVTSKFRPLWGGQNPSELKSWNTFADDMIRFLDEQGLKNIIGMGHSLGGVSTLLASIKRPDLFSKIILLDPVIFDKSYMKLINLVPDSLKKKIIPIAKVAMKRKDHWDSKEDVYESWRKKRVFKKISDSVLKDLVDCAVISNEKGKVKLAYSKEWETQVYITAPLIFKKVKKAKTRMIVVKGEQSDVITDEVWNAWQQTQLNNTFISFPFTGHLLPLEEPQALANKILSHL